MTGRFDPFAWIAWLVIIIVVLAFWITVVYELGRLFR